MQAHVQQAASESGLAAWRRSYYRLREMERQLVTAARMNEDPAGIDRRYREIEALRLATTELFTAAQVESVSHHVRLFRSSLSPGQAPQAASRSARTVPRNLAASVPALRAKP